MGHDPIAGNERLLAADRELTQHARGETEVRLVRMQPDRLRMLKVRRVAKDRHSTQLIVDLARDCDPVRPRVVPFRSVITQAGQEGTP